MHLTNQISSSITHNRNEDAVVSAQPLGFEEKDHEDVKLFKK